MIPHTEPMLSDVLERVLDAPSWTVLLVVGAVVFAEDALFVGFVLPGETLAILGGVAANRGHVSLTAVLVVVILAAIVGDSVGYEVGKHLGPRVLEAKFLANHADRVGDAQDFLARRGGWAVLLGRWVAFFRAVMPALAGVARMPYRVFLPFNAVGGIIWGTVVVLVGYLAGASYEKVEHWLGRGAPILVGVVALVALAVWWVRRRRERSRGDDVAGEA